NAGTNALASFTVTNLGGSPITDGVASIGAGPFSIVSGTPFTLGAFGSTNVVVSFTPTNAGSFSNSVGFTSGGGNSTNGLAGAAAFEPRAAFVALPTSGFNPLSVSFTDNSTGTLANRFWDFGDGTTTNSSLTNLTHVYLNASTNTVSLTVSGPLGTNQLSRPAYIQVTNLPPLLVISPTNLDFGTIIAGQTNTQSFQIVNGGGLPLNGSAATSDPFSIQSGSPYTLAPGQTGTVLVTFAPA